MYDNKRIVLGFAPTRRGFFDKTSAMENKREIRNKMNGLIDENVEIIDIDWLNEDGFLVENNDVKRVEEHFKKYNVDAIFMPHCNFGCEEVVGKLGKAMNKPFLLWGPRDDAPPANFGPRQGDTQCGLFASSKVLQRYSVPFTYIENCRVEDPAFEQGFTQFLQITSVVKAFRNMRIGQIALRPRPFMSVIVNEGELLEKFGIEVVPINSEQILDIVRTILKGQQPRFKELIDDIRQKVDCSTMSADEIRKIAALELALKEVGDENGYTAIASECWVLYQEALGIRPCFVFGDVTDRWFPVSCETDIHGAISSVLLTAAARREKPNFLADLTIRHPENDNAELLWHCGPFPKSLAKENSNPALVDCVGQWELKGGDITIARFDGIKGEYSLFAGHAKGVEGPGTNGNYVWVEVDDWAKWEKKFIYGPYIHHVAAIHGRFAPVLHEACKYMGDIKPDFI